MVNKELSLHVFVDSFDSPENEVSFEIVSVQQNFNNIPRTIPNRPLCLFKFGLVSCANSRKRILSRRAAPN